MQMQRLPEDRRVLSWTIQRANLTSRADGESRLDAIGSTTTRAPEIQRDTPPNPQAKGGSRQSQLIDYFQQMAPIVTRLCIFVLMYVCNEVYMCRCVCVYEHQGLSVCVCV